MDSSANHLGDSDGRTKQELERALCPICYVEGTFVTCWPSKKHPSQCACAETLNGEQEPQQRLDLKQKSSDSTARQGGDEEAEELVQLIYVSSNPGQDGSFDSNSSSTCNHFACRSCLVDYCRHCILQKQVPVPCPQHHPTTSSSAALTSNLPDQAMEGAQESMACVDINEEVEPDVEAATNQRANGCKAFLSDELVESILLSETTSNLLHVDQCSNPVNPAADEGKDGAYWIKKFRRCQQLALDPTLIACPRCDELCGMPSIPATKTAATQTSRLLVEDAAPESAPAKSISEDSAGSQEVAESVVSSNSGHSDAAELASSSPSRAFDANLQLHGEGNAAKTSSSLPATSCPWEFYRSCTACGHEFCAHHGNAHDLNEAACQAYLRAQQEGSPKRKRLSSPFKKKKSSDSLASAAPADDLGSKFLKQCNIKPCSRCSGLIQKSHGCDHTICLYCHEDMCWQCGTHKHLTGKVVRKCQQCQQGYLDHRYDTVHKCRTVLLLPCCIPFFVTWTALTGFVALMTGCFFACCCFGCLCCDCNFDTDIHDQNGKQKRRVGQKDNEQTSDRQEANRRRVQEEQQQRQRRPRPKRTPCQQIVYSIRVGFGCVIFPLLLFLAEMGWQTRLLDEVTEGGDGGGGGGRYATDDLMVAEIPTMPIDEDGDPNEEEDVA